MSLINGPELADRIWSIVSPHLDIEKIQEVAQNLVDVFDEFNVEGWEESDIHEVAYPFGEGKFVSLVQEFDEDGSARCTEKGKDTLKLMLEVSGKANCSILDVISCYIKDGEETAGDMDAYCLNYLMEMNECSLDTVYLEPPTKYPPEDEENELFYAYVLLCAYGFGIAFQEGGEFAGRNFRDFLAERP